MVRFLIVTVLIGILIFPFVILFLALRNRSVFKERDKILDEIQELALWDISEGISDGCWRVERYRSGPTYRAMLYKFWKPVGSFFPPVEEWTEES